MKPFIALSMVIVGALIISASLTSLLSLTDITAVAGVFVIVFALGAVVALAIYKVLPMADEKNRFLR